MWPGSRDAEVHGVLRWLLLLLSRRLPLQNAVEVAGTAQLGQSAGVATLAQSAMGSDLVLHKGGDGQGEAPGFGQEGVGE